MSQAEHAAVLFFATVTEADLSEWEARLLAWHRREGRKPRVKKPAQVFTDKQLEIAMKVLEKEKAA